MEVHVRGVEGLEYVLAAGQRVADLALSRRRLYYILLRARGDGVVLGLYGSLADEAGVVGIYRRITGGRPAYVEHDTYYLAVALPGARKLESLAPKALELERCSKGVVGFTLLGETGFLELFADSDPLQCLLEVFNARPGGRLSLSPSVLAETAQLYASPSWRLYKYNPATAEAAAYRGSYWVKASIEVTDGYVTGVWLSGVFYAAPPMEPFSILETIRGTRFDELVLSNAELAVDYRVELWGVTRDDFKNVLRSLHEKAGEKYFTVPD
ncbi:hypothetical protein [Hyperthermus butylicus]|uniref:Uncharacterized protein n=1 Tax=Hyperthermus butylicus (strain DSM 5456 / JCM 9403 / PLM1-5) TaxID=415426 RepID=A2BLI6_HYPBU|nr:hypothetical protein [Hyperthermus butylicus]ABM80847.1 hypothetical protein Hbut_1000 [Hyperthermus butylicus DSM 5456]